MGMLHNGQFVSFHQFKQGAIGIFYIGEVAASLTHVEMAVVFAAVHREGIPQFVATFLKIAHVGDIETDLNESGVAPIASLIYLARLTVQGLHQLNSASAIEWREGTLS